MASLASWRSSQPSYRPPPHRCSRHPRPLAPALHRPPREPKREEAWAIRCLAWGLRRTDEELEPRGVLLFFACGAREERCTHAGNGVNQATRALVSMCSRTHHPRRGFLRRPSRPVSSGVGSPCGTAPAPGAGGTGPPPRRRAPASCRSPPCRRRPLGQRSCGA